MTPNYESRLSNSDTELWPLFSSQNGRSLGPLPLKIPPMRLSKTTSENQAFYHCYNCRFWFLRVLRVLRVFQAFGSWAANEGAPPGCLCSPTWILHNKSVFRLILLIWEGTSMMMMISLASEDIPIYKFLSALNGPFIFATRTSLSFHSPR